MYKFFPHYRPIIPLVYDDSLSYYEQLIRLYQHFNTLSEEFNKLSQDIFEEVHNYVDNRVSGLVDEAVDRSKKYTDKEIKKIQAIYDRAIADVVKDFSEETDEIKDTITNIIETEKEIQSELIDMGIKLDTFKDQVDERFEKEYVILTKYIDEHIATVTKLYAYNPIDGKFSLIQKIVDDLYNTSRYGQLSAKEYDKCLFSANEWDNLKISAMDFLCGTKTFYFERVLNNVRNGFTGLKENIKDTIMYLINWCRYYPISAIDFGTVQLTANDYKDLNMTAFDYDFYGRSIILDEDYLRIDGLRDIIANLGQGGGVGGLLGVVTAALDGTYVAKVEEDGGTMTTSDDGKYSIN